MQKLIIDNPVKAELLRGQAEFFDSQWTVGDILTWFMVRRPDLFQRLSTPDGTEWIQKHFWKRNTIKEALTGS